MRLLRQTVGEAEVENTWAEIPARPKERATASHGDLGAWRKASGERRRLRTAGSRPATPRAPARPRHGARLTPEQCKWFGFGDEHQGVHSGQVEQAHQDDVPPNDVLPLLACARPLLAAAARRALNPRTAFLRGVAEGDLPPVGGPVRHGCERWAPAAAAAAGKLSSARADLSGRGRGLLPFRGISTPPVPAFPALLQFLLSSGFQRGLRMQTWEPGICCWRFTHSATGAELCCEEEGASARAGAARWSWGRKGSWERGGGGSARREPGRKTCIATANHDRKWGS